MKISRDHKVWLAAAGKDDQSRPSLNHVLVERTDEFVSLGQTRNGLAIAANGFVLAVVPVELEETDIPGLVQADLFRVAVKECPRTWSEVQMILNERDVSFITKNGMLTCARFSDDVGRSPEGYKFPDWRKIVPEKPTAETEPRGTFTLDLALFRQISDAVGIPTPRLTRTPPQNNYQSEGPLILQSMGSDGKVEPPYGLIMPFGKNPR